MYSTKEFIEKFTCKSGESVEQLNDSEFQIHRWTVRTFKTLGNVLASEQYDTHPNEAIIKLNLKPNSRRTTLPLSNKHLEEALHKGWIIQEVRFTGDGRTPHSTVYRMGPGLFAYEKLKKERESVTDRLLKEKLQAEIDMSVNVLPGTFLQKIYAFSDEIKDSESWTKDRIRKFHAFLIGYLQLRRLKSRIEFKEIGATYYKKIGGSKAFDNYKQVFIDRLEKWLNAPVNELGIISLGTIVSIYFTGSLRGEFSSYSSGTVHATTDIGITDEHFKTQAKVLWLVENRAVLTRMASEKEFIDQTQSFVLGVDGQVRGAHRKMISQLCLGSSIERVMIWVDYDKAGQIIARDLVNIIQNVPHRLIGNEDNVFTTYEAYVKWSATIKNAEQEMTLGGAEAWKRWINQ